MSAAKFVLPRRLFVGGGSVSQLGSVLQSLGRRRPLIVTDGVLKSNGALARVEASLDQAGIQSECFSETIPDPTSESVDRLARRLASGTFDSMVAVGGGSPMDTAKAAGALHEFGGKMTDYKVPFQQDGELTKTPIVAIPTTAGTGSEATRFTVVTDSETGEKNLYAGAAFVPAAAIVDYELTLTCPWRLTADTGIDALCHAVEAYVSRRRNWFSDALALEAVGAIGAKLRKACHGEPAAREAMMLAATQAGIAFSNSSVTLIHGMSRPLGAHFKVPHGLSNAMLAPIVTKFSVDGPARDRYADIARALGVASHHRANLAADFLYPALLELNHDLNVPTLRDYGVDRAAFDNLIPRMANEALASGSPNNNPVVPKAAEIETIYHQVYA